MRSCNVFGGGGHLLSLVEQIEEKLIIKLNYFCISVFSLRLRNKKTFWAYARAYMLHVWSTGIYGACTLSWDATVVRRNFIQTETFDPIWTVHINLSKNRFELF